MPHIDDTYTRKHLVLGYDSELGAAVAAIRDRQGKSQVEVAEALGCVQSLISKIEKGQRGIKFSELGLLAQALGISRDELLETLLSALDRAETKAEHRRPSA